MLASGPQEPVSSMRFDSIFLNPFDIAAIGSLCLLILVLLVTHWSPDTHSKVYSHLVALILLKALGKGIYYITD